MLEKLPFPLRCLFHPWRSGTIFQTCHEKAQAISKVLHADAQHVVELGPGDGRLTQYLLDRLPPKGRLLAIEVDQGMYQGCKENIQDPRLEVVCDDARNIVEILTNQSFGAVDQIFSGIPKQFVTDDLLTSMKEVLSDNGSFVTYQVRKSLRKNIKHVFGDVYDHPLPNSWRGIRHCFESHKNGNGNM
jgi:phospholipid N-methyltransferase